MAVIERHMASGAVGKGFVRGIGLRRGAIASSVAHDHHNLVVIGADDRSMMTAARRVAELHGGMVVADRRRRPRGSAAAAGRADERRSRSASCGVRSTRRWPPRTRSARRCTIRSWR